MDKILQKNNWGELFFKYRDYTPIPLILILFMINNPNILSATLGTLIIVLGEMIRLYSVAFIGSISRTRKDNLGSQLVTTGPFAIVRNPLYLGNFFIVSGIALYSGVLWFILLSTALFYFQYHYIIQYEESLLEKKFGNDYLIYRQKVPCWVPKSIPRIEDLEIPSSFVKAVKSEKRTFTAIAAMLVLLSLVS